jgi:peptidoglycan hydrolase-like protein with peptidoglycan-binding domain
MKGRTSLLKLRLLDYDDPEPYANKPYRLEVEGELYEGTIDAEGCLEARIDPRAKRATLHVGPEQLDLTLGGLDPIDSVSGAQQRLAALGYYASHGSHAEWDAASLDALKRFQSACLITPSGKYDATTRAKLEETYGC